MPKSTQPQAQEKEALHSALQEASRLLTLGLSQLQQARHDNDCHMQQLIQAHTTLADYLADDHPDVHHAMQDMVIAFQGHDDLNQRFEHFQWLFEQISSALSQPEQLAHSGLAKLETEMEQRYTTASERIVHRHYRDGDLDSADGEQCPAPQSGSIELF